MKDSFRIGRFVSPFIFVSVSIGIQSFLFAQPAGTSAGMTLTEAAGARPMALGEAYSAATDDIAGFSYNPASLESLKSGQASFFYHSGMADDAYGQFMIGSPFKDGSLGLSVGYFDGGKINLFDGTTQRTVTVQRDLSVGLGYSFYLGNVDWGFAGKYLSSQLAETKTATAYAADAGFQFSLGSRLRFGSAIQNIGTQLKYKDEGDNLPRTARTGVSFLVIPGRSAARIMVDGIYDLNDSKVYPALGLEKLFGPLAFRAGYKGTNGLNQFSVGMGFLVSRFAFDYSFGMVNQLQSTHMISLSTRFDSLFMRDRFSPIVSNREERPEKITESKNQELAKPPQSISFPQQPPTKWEESPRKSHVYIVKEGETLQTIAQKIYGNKDLWTQIYNANRHLLINPTSLQPGQEIVLPTSQ